MSERTVHYRLWVGWPWVDYETKRFGAMLRTGFSTKVVPPILHWSDDFAEEFAGMTR